LYRIEQFGSKNFGRPRLDSSAVGWMDGSCLITGTYEILFAYLKTAMMNILAHSKQSPPCMDREDLTCRGAGSGILMRFSMT